MSPRAPSLCAHLIALVGRYKTEWRRSTSRAIMPYISLTEPAAWRFATPPNQRCPVPCRRLPGLAEKVHGLVTDAVARGARLLAGGELRPTAASGGQFYPPTLLADVGPGMKIWEEEVFGPVSGHPEGFQR